jgi:hypothetical protein
MPNYKLTKKSVKNARISKHKKSKSLINKMKGGNNTVIYSNDLIKWSPSMYYQEKAVNEAIVYFKSNLQRSFEYNKNGYNFRIMPIGKSTFIMLREDNTFAYLRKEGTTYIKKKVKSGEIVSATYLGKSFTLNHEQIYYVDESNPSEPVIGWHESINPPLDMDGNSSIKDTDKVIDETGVQRYY